MLEEAVCVDEEGNEIKFLILDEISMEDKEYVVVFYEDEEAGGKVLEIFKEENRLNLELK